MLFLICFLSFMVWLYVMVQSFLTVLFSESTEQVERAVRNGLICLVCFALAVLWAWVRAI
jgi:hypothetical protein